MFMAEVSSRPWQVPQSAETHINRPSTDEVSAVVLDPGYCLTRAGYAGEDVPKCVLPSSYAHIGKDEKARTLFGDEVLFPRLDLELRNYMNRDSTVEDWDMASQIWEHMLIHRLSPEKKVPPSVRNGNEGDGDVAMEDVEAAEKPLAENPVLMTEAAWNSPKAREKSIELAMEGWGVPAFWFVRTPVAAAFAAGKASAIVVDVGGANASVTAVHDGMVLKRSIQRSPAAGLWLSGQIREMWKTSEPKVDIIPSYMVENKTPVDAGQPAQARLRHFPFAIHESYRLYEEERLLTEFKESVVEVWRGPGRFTPNEEYVRSQPGRVFEMPDGSTQMWREQRLRVTEGMWEENFDGGYGERVAKGQTIPELIKASLQGVDTDLRLNLLANVVITGSTTLLNGFNDRLNAELVASWPNNRIKLHSAGLTTERRFGAWIGGSILASLGTFHQMWISRKEYEENGAGIVEKRCK